MISMKIIDKTKNWGFALIMFALILGAYAWGMYQGSEDGFYINSFQSLLEYQAPFRGIYSISAGILLGVLALTVYLQYKIDNSPHEIVKKLKLALNENDDDEEVEIK